MLRSQMTILSHRTEQAWNSQDVDRVLDCYQPDLIYLDPNTRGEIKGAEAMRRYLTKLFAQWQMHWNFKELHPLADGSGSAVTWNALLRPQGSKHGVQINGMDLVLIERGLIKRNEVYFDRAALASLL